jgi:hypothetical protein
LNQRTVPDQRGPDRREKNLRRVRRYVGVMVRLEASRSFAIGRAAAFDYITNPGNWPQYWPGLVAVATIADHLQGVYHLPGESAMQRETDAHRRSIATRYVASKRHTIQVDFDDYMRDLRFERRRGAHRAAGTPADRAVASGAARAARESAGSGAVV